MKSQGGGAAVPHKNHATNQAQREFGRYVAGRNASPGMRFALAGVKGPFGRGVREQASFEKATSYKRGGRADVALRSGGLEGLARAIVQRHPLWKETRHDLTRRVVNENPVSWDKNRVWATVETSQPGAFHTKPIKDKPFGSFGIQKIPGAYGMVYGKDRNLRLSPDTAAGVIGSGPEGGDWAKSMLMGNYGTPMRNKFEPSRNPTHARKTLVHELIHASGQGDMDPLGMSRDFIEGEADSVSRKISPKIYKDMGMTFSSKQLPKHYPYEAFVKAYEKQLRHRSRDIWTKEGLSNFVK